MDGSIVDDLPRIKGGNKSADHFRIDKQVDRFHQMFDPPSPAWNGHTITGVQLELENDTQVSHIDFATKYNGVTHLFDLKLTGDVEATHGDYSWGNVETMDLLQAPTYVDMWHEKYGEWPLFHYLVFDYSSKLGVLWVEVEVTEDAVYRKRSRFQEIETTIMEYMDKWPEIPSPSSCKLCPLNCSKRVIEYNIKHKRIVL